MRLDTGSPSPRTVAIEVAEPNSRFSTSAANSSAAPGPRSSPEDPSSASRKSSLTANERRLQKNSYPCLLLRTEKKKRRHQRGDRAETKRSRADFSCSSAVQNRIKLSRISGGRSALSLMRSSCILGGAASLVSPSLPSLMAPTAALLRMHIVLSVERRKAD